MSSKPYDTCPECNSNLDHGEKCKCRGMSKVKQWVMGPSDFCKVILETGEEIQVTYQDYLDACVGSVHENVSIGDVVDYAIYRHQNRSA